MQTHSTESTEPQYIGEWLGYGATAYVWAINQSTYIVTIHGSYRPTIEVFSNRDDAIQHAKNACGIECFPADFE